MGQQCAYIVALALNLAYVLCTAYVDSLLFAIMVSHVLARCIELLKKIGVYCLCAKGDLQVRMWHSPPTSCLYTSPQTPRGGGGRRSSSDHKVCTPRPSAPPPAPPTPLHDSTSHARRTPTSSSSSSAGTYTHTHVCVLSRHFTHTLVLYCGSGTVAGTIPVDYAYDLIHMPIHMRHANAF